MYTISWSVDLESSGSESVDPGFSALEVGNFQKLSFEFNVGSKIKHHVKFGCLTEWAMSQHSDVMQMFGGMGF